MVAVMSIVVAGVASSAPSAISAAPGNCYVPRTHADIEAAIDDLACSRIVVGRGEWDGDLIDRQVAIVGQGGAVIKGGPAHGSGLSQGFRLMAGSDGSSITGLTFTTDLSIMNGAGVDSVTVTHNTFLNSVQAISNWRGSDWVISHNKIVDLRTRCGGGIGILIGDYAGGTVSGNVVSHNSISGTLHVSAGDCGGYNGSGIVLYADFRWGAAGTAAMTGNRIVKNHVALVSDNAADVDAVAFELTDSRGDASLPPVIHDNAVGFNDFRGTALQIVLTPSNLGDVNDISRNLGDNRGHGLAPSLFGPGGN